jgi:hypothetical protein
VKFELGSAVGLDSRSASGGRAARLRLFGGSRAPCYAFVGTTSRTFNSASTVTMSRSSTALMC